MSSFTGFKFVQVFIVILISWVSLTTLPLKGYCDDWVYIGGDANSKHYYNSKNIKIDQQSKQIKVWTKWTWTKKGKGRYIKMLKDMKADTKGYERYSHTLLFILYDYNNMRSQTLSYVDYTIDDEPLISTGSSDWGDIIPKSINSKTLNKILKDYQIKK